MKRSDIRHGQGLSEYECPHCGSIVDSSDEIFIELLTVIADASKIAVDDDGYCINWFGREPILKPHSIDSPCCGKRLAIGFDFPTSIDNFTQYVVACRTPADIEYLKREQHP